MFVVLFQCFYLRSLVVLQLVHSLDQGTETTAAGTQGVVPLVTLDIVFLPDLSPHQHDGDARRDETAHEQVEAATLAKVLRRVVDLTAVTPVRETACSHVIAAAESSVVPLLRHVELLSADCVCYSAFPVKLSPC